MVALPFKTPSVLFLALGTLLVCAVCGPVLAADPASPAVEPGGGAAITIIQKNPAQNYAKRSLVTPESEAAPAKTADGKSTPEAGDKTVTPVDGGGLVKHIAGSKGKVVLLNFFASWCGPCRKEIPELIALYEELPKDKVIFYGVSIDQDPKALQNFVAQREFNYPLLLASDSASRLFRVSGVPKLMLYGPDGKLAFSQSGYTPGGQLKMMITSMLE